MTSDYDPPEFVDHPEIVHHRLQEARAELALFLAQREVRRRKCMQILKKLLQRANLQGTAYDPAKYFPTFRRTPESVFSEPAGTHEISRGQETPPAKDA